jgi:hypothetical protein
MRVRTILALAVVSTLSAGATLMACGGDEATPADAGGKDTSVADTSVADTSVPDSSDAGCAVSGNLQDLLKVDAAGIDSGGINLSVCFNCVTTSCKSSVDQCNADCECKTGVVQFADCVGKGGKATTCGAQLVLGLSGNAQSIATGLLGCVQASCSAQCIPGDGGLPDAAILKDAGPG